MTASTQSQSQSQSPSQIELTAASTLHLLEARLHRLTYLLTGDTAWTGTPTPPAKPASHDETVSRKLQRLEGELENLSGRSAAVRDVLGLYDRFPDLFSPSSSTQPPSDPSDTSSPQDPESTSTTSPTAPESQSQNQNQTQLPDLPLSTLQSIILSYASTIPETASRLTSLNDTPVPDPTLSAGLIELMPRMEKLSGVQDGQAREIADLRVRTAKVLQRVYEVSLLGGGEVWGEWEGRIENAERGVRRGEVAVGREGI